MKIACASAFLASLAARFSGKLVELRLLSIWRYRERTRPLFLAKSSAVAQITPCTISLSHFTSRSVLRVVATPAI
ncbi:hypothetical protein ACFX14_027920 [Malus domestica]